MNRIVRRLALIVVCAVALAPATAVEAQRYGYRAGQQPAALYPYELQSGQPYAVEVAPNTYVIHRRASRRGYRAARRHFRHTTRRQRSAHATTRRPKRTHANRALIEKLRRRDLQRTANLAAQRAAERRAALKRAARRADEKTAKQRARQAAKPTRHEARKTADDKAVTIVRTRKIVHDKPVVIVTRRVVDDPPKIITRRRYVDGAPASERNVEPRVIHADAEITILGPDRMMIRLMRKGGEPLVLGDGAPKRVRKHIRKLR